MKDKVEWNASEHTTDGSLTSSLLDKSQLTKTCHPEIPITYHVAYSGAFFLLTSKPKERNSLQSTSEKLPLWNQSLTVTALFKPLWVYHYHNGYMHTGWQIILDTQMTPSKFSVMSLLKLRWTLSFTDRHR